MDSKERRRPQWTLCSRLRRRWKTALSICEARQGSAGAFTTHAAPRLLKALSTELFKIVLREVFVGPKEPFLGRTHFISVKVECCEFNSAYVIGDLEKPIAGRLDIPVNNRSIE